MSLKEERRDGAWTLFRRRTPAHNGVMQNSENRVNRSLIGIAALVCVASAGGLWLFAPDSNVALAAFWRVGLVMSALWMAMPRTGESIAWGRAVPIILAVVLLMVVTRNAAKFAVPLAILVILATLVLRPRPKRGPRSPR